MTTATTKFQLGTAALAMAAAAAITPVVAQADSIAPLAPSLTSFSKALGSSAVCDPTSSDECASLVVAGSSSNASALGSIFQNNLIWIGEQNPNFYNSPDTVEVWTFTPLNAVLWAEPFIPGLFNWFNSQESSTCFAGITTSLGGPYSAAGTYTHSYNHGGCNPS